MSSALPHSRPQRAWVMPYFLRQWNLLGALAVILLLTVGFQLGTPLLLRAFLDSASQQVAMQTILLFAALYIVAAFVLRGLRVGENYLAELVAWKVTNALRIDLVRHCLALDLSFHLRHTPGELIERIDGDVGVLNNFFSRFVLVLITNTLVVTGVIAILTTIDGWLGLTLTIFACLYVAAIFWLNTATVATFVKALEAEAKLFGFLEEHMSGTEEIRANGATGYVLRLLTEFMHQRLVKQQHAEVVQGLISIVRMLLYIVGTLSALAFAAILYRQGRITIGTAYIIFSYMYIVWDPLRDLVYQFSDYRKALAALQRISGLLAVQSTITDGERESLPPGPLALRVEQVSFSYNGEDYNGGDQALREVTFALDAGCTLGIIGQTGSGKSTLTRLLFRLYEPQQGYIYLNDVDIRHVTLRALSARVALVTQDVQLFYASLRDNITFLDRTIADSAILEAFDTLGLSDWYARLPAGLETPVQGTTFSAGQAQLIALTRVFLQKPDLIILDEAASRLDPLTEALVQQALDKLLRGRSAVIVAHRLQTINKVDTILVLDEGQVIEFGPRPQMAGTQDSHYARLLSSDGFLGEQR